MFIRVISILFLTCLLLGANSSFSQKSKNKQKEKDANGNFEDGNYTVALGQFLKLYAKDKLNVDYNYKIGVCYLNSNIDKSLAVPYLEYAIKQANPTNETFLQLGRAYYHSLQFDKAQDMFSKYLELNSNQLSKDAELSKIVQREIQMCTNAKDFLKRPINVTFVNLGSNVNSNKSDYYPFLSPDEKTVYFTSNRKYVSDFQELTNDIYMTSVSFWGRWGSARSIGSKINTSDEHEIMVGLSADGETVIVNPDNYVGFQDLFVSRYSKGKYNELETLGEIVNSKGEESGACFTQNKDTLFFASDRQGGLGGLDIWMSILLPDGTWAIPQNLGEGINTEYDEDMPAILPDGNTLYFCSKGHNSMGGFDIFYSKRINPTDKWPKPKNMGYPINDTYDNMNIALSKKGRYGYVSAVRKEGLGDYDIYKCIFNYEEAKPIVFRGKVAVDSIKPKSPKDIDPEIEITVKEKLANEPFGIYKYNRNNDYFILSLPPGIYDVEVEGSSYKPYKRTIEVLDEMANDGVIEYNIYLKKKQ